MQFVEAFEALGYVITNPRQDWTAEKPGGICLSLWSKEVGREDGLMWMNTKVHAKPLEIWQAKAGNRKRIAHLRRALEEFGGEVDVILLGGTPGTSYGSAQPWIAEGRRAGTFWQVTHLDDETGHFEVRLRKSDLSPKDLRKQAD